MTKKITKVNTEKLVGVITIVLVAIVGIVLVSSRISSPTSVSPNSPESKAEASDGGPMCGGQKCCPMCDCVNGACILSNPNGGNRENIQNKPTTKPVQYKAAPKKSGKFRSE
jgi:hypothetical protein